MKHFIHDETAEFAIDAIFGITFFMISLIAIMFMALIIRVQSNIQYALGQTAKEVSGYYYLVDKVGLAAVSSGSNKITDVDTTIKSIVDFSGSAEDTFNSVQNFPIDDVTFESIKNSAGNVKSNVEQSYKDFQSIETNLKSLNGDSVTQVLSVFAKTAINTAVGNFIAPIICEKLMPKYLSANNLDEYCEKAGISNPSFKSSQFLADGRSIKIQITYQMNLEKYTLGMVKSSIYFKQAASTAAWVRPNEETLLSLSKLGYEELE